MFSVRNSELTPLERRTIFTNVQSPKEAETISADNGPMLQSPQAENQHLVHIAETQVNDAFLKEQERYLAEFARAQAAENALLEKLKPVQPICFGGRLMMIANAIWHQPLDALFQSNLLSDEEIDATLRESMLNAEDFKGDEKQQISEIFFGPIFKSEITAGNDLKVLARDFADNFRLKRLQTTDVLLNQMDKLGPSKFLKLQKVMLNDQLVNALGLENLRTQVKLKIASGVSVSFLMNDVMNVLGNLVKNARALPELHPDGIKARGHWEQVTGFKTLLTFFANYLETSSLPESSAVSENSTIDDKINSLVECLSSALIEDAMFADEMFIVSPLDDNCGATGCLAPVDLSEIGNHHGLDYVSPVSIIEVFLRRAEKTSAAIAAYDTKLERLASLTDGSTSEIITTKIDQAKRQLVGDFKEFNVVHAQLERFTKLVGVVGAAYLLNIKRDKDKVNSVSFESVKEWAGLASRLTALFDYGALEDTGNVKEVLSALDGIPSFRFMNMLVAHANGRRYQLPCDKGKVTNGNANIELGALFERLQSSFQHGISAGSSSTRSMAQNVLSVVAQKSPSSTAWAFFNNYLKDQYQKPTEGIVQRYMTNVAGCYLQRTMVESLIQERLNKVDESLDALWRPNYLTSNTYQQTYEQLRVLSRLKNARALAERNFTSELNASIQNKIALGACASGASAASAIRPNEDILTFLNNVIKFQSEDAKQPQIDQKAFYNRRAVIANQVSLAVDAEEKTKWDQFSQFYNNCEGLARAVVQARKNNNLPWGARMALLSAEADLQNLYDSCDSLDTDDFSGMAPELRKAARDPRITEIMDLLVGGNYNFQFSDQDAVRTSLRRIMMILDAPGVYLENPLFESNALDYRLALAAPEVTQSRTYTSSPDTLSVQLSNLAEVQNYVFRILPSLLSRSSTDSARLHSDILVPLERITQSLLPLPECPIIKEVHREIVGLLNFALKAHPKALSPIAASILIRSEVRDRTDGDVILSDIINKTDHLVEQLLKPAYLASPKALTSAALALLKDVLPLMYDERVESPTVQTALEMLNHERLAGTLPSLVRQAENDVEVLADANAFKALVETFTNFKSLQFPDIDQMLKYYLFLKDLPEDTEPWVQRAALQKLDQARYLMQPPEDAEAGAIWSERIDELRKTLTRVGLDALEIVAPDIRGAKGVNGRYLYLDEDISTLIQNAIERSNLKAETEETEDQAQRRVRAQSVTLAPSAVGTVETLNDRVNEWLSDAIASEMPRVLILPYNPANTDGSNSLHWTAIILHLSAENALTVNYMNPLYADSPIPPTLMRDMTGIVASFDQDQKTAVTKQMRFVPILHSSQDDATSCGPRIVADIAQVIEHWRNNGVISVKLPVIKDVDALRQAHLEELGGLDSEFGQRQLWNLVYSDGADLDERAVRAQDRLKEALLDDLVTIHAADPNNFALIKDSPKEKTWRTLTKNSTITRLINSDNLLTPDQLIKLAVEAAEKVFAMQSALESLYETDLEIVGDFIALQQLSGKSDHSHEQLAGHLRNIMTSYIEGAQNAQTRKLFSNRFDNTDTLDRVIRGFYPTFKGINVDPKVSDLPGEIDAFRKVLPSIDLAKSGYLKMALGACLEAEESDPVGTFELIQGLKQALKPTADSSIDKKQEISDTPDVSACWQLMQRQIDTQGDSALLLALYPEALREKYKTAQDIPKVYDDVLRMALSKINLSSSARVGEIAKILQDLRRMDMTLYREIFSVGKIETVSDRLRNRYLAERNTLAEQEATVAGLQVLEGQQVEVEQEGVASVARINILAIAQKRRDRSVNEINALLPLLEKVFVNFNHTLSDDDVRALQSVPSDMLNMAVSQARYASERVRPKKSAYNYWNSASRFTGFWRS